MTNVIYEVIKEFKIEVDELKYAVRARILKRKEGDSGLIGDYKWEISHYYCPDYGATVYIPSRSIASTYEESEHLLFMYLRNFTNFDVQPNPYY
jgi:hypothetical protein